jgi:hypothetical protein
LGLQWKEGAFLVGSIRAMATLGPGRSQFARLGSGCKSTQEISSFCRTCWDIERPVRFFRVLSSTLIRDGMASASRSSSFRLADSLSTTRSRASVVRFEVERRFLRSSCAIVGDWWISFSKSGMPTSMSVTAIRFHLTLCS